MTPLEQLDSTITELIKVGGLLDQLRELLPTSAGTTGEGGTHQKISGSPAPWNGAAGGVLMSIHAGVRQLEAELRRYHGLPIRTRGGSDANTVEAFGAIQGLVVATPDFVLRDTLGRVLGWVNAAKQVEQIGEASVWVPIPRVPGQPPRACPHCRFYSLRMCKSLGLIRCTTRACRNADGRHWTWTVEELLGKGDTK